MRVDPGRRGGSPWVQELRPCLQRRLPPGPPGAEKQKQLSPKRQPSRLKAVGGWGPDLGALLSRVALLPPLARTPLRMGVTR